MRNTLIREDQMKKILLVRSNKAYLPQIDASIDYFNEKKLGFQLYDSAEISDIVLSEFDCLWQFMGLDVSKKVNIPVIHEYASLSTGLFPQLKNKSKRILNYKPNLRIYLNKFVSEELGFNDEIAYVYRDMGVDDVFFEYQDSPKNYDCVYLGSITKERRISYLLDYFKWNCKNRSLLLIGGVSDEIYKQYSSCDNITFTGNLPYKEVPKYASQAIYGVNYMPNIYPYNLQTSTKLLEYLAMGLEVITTEYLWIHHFMKENHINLIMVDEKLTGLESVIKKHERNLSEKKVNNVEKFKWKHVIEQSGLEGKLLNIL